MYLIKNVGISTKNFRLQAQVIKMPGLSILWLNSYFPTDPQSAQYDEQELVELLTEVENILDKEEFDHVLWGGDFNWDKSRVTSFSMAITNFMEKIGLVSVWDKFPVFYTHVHTPPLHWTISWWTQHYWRWWRMLNLLIWEITCPDIVR